MQKSINTENIPNESLWNLTLLEPMVQIRPIICLRQWTKNAFYVFFNSVQFSCSVMSDSLQPHGFQHARLPCPSPTPGVYSSSCPLSQRCHPTISSSGILFSCPQSFPASGSFLMSLLFTSGGQTTGVSASAWVLLMNIQDWFPLA